MTIKKQTKVDSPPAHPPAPWPTQQNDMDIARRVLIKFFLLLTPEEQEQHSGDSALTPTMDRWIPKLYQALTEYHTKENLPAILENVMLAIADVYQDLGTTKEEVLTFIDYARNYTLSQATKH